MHELGFEFWSLIRHSNFQRKPTTILPLHIPRLPETLGAKLRPTCDVSHRNDIKELLWTQRSFLTPEDSYSARTKDWPPKLPHTNKCTWRKVSFMSAQMWKIATLVSNKLRVLGNDILWRKSIDYFVWGSLWYSIPKDYRGQIPKVSIWRVTMSKMTRWLGGETLGSSIDW